MKVVYAEAEAGSGAATPDKLALLFPELAPADIATAK
ncbi:MAG: hypothetical protein QOF55_644, partial [Thermoleophilaceae bacterium]|nr:hypothetical protein [Thermoleophilaceae bacterium]